MIVWVFGIGIIWLLYATRGRLQQAEQRVKALEALARDLTARASAVGALELELRRQGVRLVQLERQADALGAGAAVDAARGGEEAPPRAATPDSLDARAAQHTDAYAPTSETLDARAAQHTDAYAPLTTAAPVPRDTDALRPGRPAGADRSDLPTRTAALPPSAAVSAATRDGSAVGEPSARSVPTPPDSTDRTRHGARSGNGNGDGPVLSPGDLWITTGLNAARELLLGGNPVVRVGILILLVGVALLLGWAAEHDLFPIALRLTLASLGALGLAAWGVRERKRKPDFGLTLQGGGIAALYLVVCFAYRRYELLPPGLTLALLVGLTLASGCLSVLQDSTTLIFIAQLFGFAAPLLASSGRGDHVALFSYYLLLNALVFAVAFFKAWRPLNLLGFVFTFGIATAWGALRYEPAAFSTTEPFLLSFFALYLVIPILFALRHAGTPRGWVDGGLVFGTPLSVLALQWKLVHDRPFAMAYSVSTLATIYLGLALAIRRSRSARLAALGEAYLPIGVGFATLAIPYGLNDSDLTGAAWALEGAGLYWVGARQERWLSRAAGVALGLLAIGAAHGFHTHALHVRPILNSEFLVNVLLAVSLLFIARCAHARRTALHGAEWRGLQLFIPVGLYLWAHAAFGELGRTVPHALSLGAQLVVLGGTGIACELVGRRLAWSPARVAGFALWPLMLLYLQRYSWDLDEHPLRRGGWFGWAFMGAAFWLVLRRTLEELPRLRTFVRPAHASAVWLWALFGVRLLEQLGRHQLQLDESYGASAGTLSLALWAAAITRQSRMQRWPSGVHLGTYAGLVVPGLLLWGAWRSAAANVSFPIDAAPLPYVPIANALDLSSLIGAGIALVWLRRMRQAPAIAWADASHLRALALGVGVLVFAWWNCMLARSVHHYAGVEFDADRLFESSLFQLSLSLSWTLIAFVAMLLAHRRRLRGLWLSGAGLLAAVVIKLFVIDLSQLSPPAKIGSFLGVGVLLLLVGYIAPVPPRPNNREPHPS